MIEVRRDREIHRENGGWFVARWHFSFDRYRDPQQMGVGPLRVFNHDQLAPGAVWPMHPHADIEGITYVWKGSFRHADSLGNDGILQPGGVQVMTLGAGADHSDGMRIIHEQYPLILSGGFNERGKRRKVAFHAEDAVGCNESEPVRDPSIRLELLSQVRNIRVLITYRRHRNRLSAHPFHVRIFIDPFEKFLEAKLCRSAPNQLRMIVVEHALLDSLRNHAGGVARREQHREVLRRRRHQGVLEIDHAQHRRILAR